MESLPGYDGWKTTDREYERREREAEAEEDPRAMCEHGELETSQERDGVVIQLCLLCEEWWVE